MRHTLAPLQGHHTSNRTGHAKEATHTDMPARQQQLVRLSATAIHALLSALLDVKGLHQPAHERARTVSCAYVPNSTIVKPGHVEQQSPCACQLDIVKLPSPWHWETWDSGCATVWYKEGGRGRRSRCTRNCTSTHP